MAGNGALDLSIRIMGKVDPSLARSISQVKGLTGSLADGLKSTNSLASAATKTLGAVGKAGLGIMATLTASATLMTKKATDMAEKYQAQAADAVKYVGGIMNDDGSVNQKKRATMEDAILKMTTQVPIQRDEMAQIAAALGQSGKNYEQIFLDNKQTGAKSYLYDTARMAAAWDIEAKSAADYMAKWETAFGKTHNQIIDIADSINYLGGHMATTAAEIAEVVNTSGGVGQTAGADLHTTSALAATMLAMGVDTGKSGTSLNRVYTNMTLGNSATKAQTAAWNALGFDPVQIAKDMQSTGPNGEDGAASTLYKVFEAISKQDAYQQTATIKTLFGQWAIEGVSKIVGNLPAFQNALLMAGNTSAYSGSMEKELLVRLDTSEAVSQMASNATDRLLINIGNQFLPVKKELTSMWIDIANGITESLPDLSNLANSILPLLRTAVEGIGAAAQWALPWIQKGIDYLANNGPQAAGGIAAIIAAFGAMSMAPAAYSAGSTALSVVKNLTIGGKASGAPGGRFGGITVGNLMGLLSPTSLFQNTISGGSGLWSNRSNILKSAKMGAWMANSSGQGGIAGRLSSLAGGVIGALNSDALTSGKKKPMQAVAGKIFGAAGYINNVANIPTNAMNAMIAAANPAGTATATIGNVLGAGAKAVFGKGGLNLTGGIGAVAGKLGGGFMSLLGTFGPAITSLGTMVAVVSLLGDHFEDVRTIIGQIFGEGGLAVFDAFTGKLSGIGDTIKQVFGQLTTPEGLQSIQEKLSNFSIGGLNLGDVFGAAMPAIQTVMPLIQSFAGVFGQIVDLGANHIKPLLVEVFGFVVNQGIPAVMPLLSTVVSLVGTVLVNAIKTVIDVIGKLLPVAEPVVLGIIGLVKGIVGVVVNVVNAIIRTLNKINFTVPDWVPALGGKQFGFNLTEVTLPKFADGGFTNGPSLAGEAGTEAIISFRRSQREQNIDTWMQAGKMLGVPIASAMIQGSDFGVAFRRTTELANYAADALEGAAASGNATAQKVLDNSRVQQALSLVRRADVAQAQLERLSNLDNYDLSNVSLFPTADDPELTRQNLAMMENLQNRQQEVSVPNIGGSGSSGQGESSGGGGYQRSYTSSSGNTYVYAPNFVIYGSMDANDLRSLLDEGYEKFCEYVERYEREKRRTQYGT
jgi:TP901 family phage tail tape measure protein|nr:MAG TPA: minor tail protein [Caudoviricetes sp.]